MSDWDQFWGPPHPYHGDPPPASEDDVRRREEPHGVRLPATLAKALTIQNGGYVRGAELCLEPLAGISALSESKCDHVFVHGDEAIPDRAMLFSIGSVGVLGVGVILDYNGRAEPQVLFLPHDLGDELRDEGVGSFDELLQLVRRWGGA
jgi:hypothetical protein